MDCRRIRLLACALFGLLPAAAAAQVQFSPVQTHTGSCEPSAAVAIPPGSVDQRFIVADDEGNVLRLYAPEGGPGLPLAGGDLNTFLGVKPDQKVDLEAATWLNGKAYWISSHSRNWEGELKPRRWQFFSTAVSGSPGAPALTPTSAKPSHGLLPALAKLPELAASIRLDKDEDQTLAPDNGGFNIEGLSARADGKGLLIGLRSPLAADGRAYVVPLENPDGVIAADDPPVLGKPTAVALGGRGIRSMDYSAAAKAYFIVAGPSTNGPEGFDLYRWPEDEKQAPEPVPGFADQLRMLPAFTPEALVVDASGKRLHLFSDDGDICRESAPSFRSVAVTLP